jgi:hypothetical protein
LVDEYLFEAAYEVQEAVEESVMQKVVHPIH